MTLEISVWHNVDCRQYGNIGYGVFKFGNSKLVRLWTKNECLKNFNNWMGVPIKKKKKIEK